MTGTIFCDEAGNFGDATDRRSRHSIVGGIVVPGSQSDDLRRRWRNCFAPLRAIHGTPSPPHARELPDEVLAAFVGQAVQHVGEADGAWIFVRAPVVAGDAPFLEYQRTLETWVDISARYARAQGSAEIEVQVSQRTVALSDDDRRRAENLETGIESAWDPARLRTLVKPGIRASSTQLEREGGIRIVRIGVESANSPQGHPALHMCDLGCFCVRDALHVGSPAPRCWPPRALERLYVLTHDDALVLRELDRVACEDALDLLRVFQLSARLAARARDGRLTTASAARFAGVLCDAAAQRWASAARTDAELVAVVVRLAAAVFGVLEAKTGDYEGAWMALHVAWAGDGPLAVRTRRLIVEVEQRVMLERLTLECANHRGDVNAAREAWRRCRDAARSTQSLTGLGEMFRASNVHHVMVQNRLPAPQHEVEDVRRELANGADELERLTRGVAELWSIAPELGVGDAPAPKLTSEERGLWEALGRPAPALIRNREVGRALGTAARTWAFLGQHDRALTTALDARSRFGGDPFDLAFNATVLLRVLCDEARIHGESPTRARAFELLLGWSGCAAMVHAARTARELAEHPHLRFAVDGVLRTLLWAPSTASGLAASWHREVAKGADSALYGVLARVLRSHPSELIARHAGELSRGPARAAWFELSLAICREAPTGSTLRRFAAFTEALHAGVAPEGAPGSLLAPTFEYR